MSLDGSYDGIVSIYSSLFDSLVVEARLGGCINKRMKKKQKFRAEEENIVGMVIEFHPNPTAMIVKFKTPEPVKWWEKIGRLSWDKLYTYHHKFKA